MCILYYMDTVGDRVGRQGKGIFLRAASLFRHHAMSSYALSCALLGRGDDTVGNPHRAQIVQFELFELILLLTLAKQFPVERFEATVSQSTVPSPPVTS